jgi:hypothetical protein
MEILGSPKIKEVSVAKEISEEQEENGSSVGQEVSEPLKSNTPVPEPEIKLKTPTAIPNPSDRISLPEALARLAEGMVGYCLNDEGLLFSGLMFPVLPGKS